MQPSNQQQQMQHMQQQQQRQQQFQAGRMDLTVSHVLDRFYERARHESAEEAPMEWQEASGGAYKTILGDIVGDPAQPTPPVHAMMIPEGLAAGQMPVAPPPVIDGQQVGGQPVQMVPLQVIQRGFFQQPQMGGQGGQMVPVAFPQQMQMMSAATMPPQGHQRSSGGGYGQQSQQGQGSMQPGPRGKGQDHSGQNPGASVVQMAFTQGYPQAFMIPTPEHMMDQEQY